MSLGDITPPSALLLGLCGLQSSRLATLIPKGKDGNVSYDLRLSIVLINVMPAIAMPRNTPTGSELLEITPQVILFAHFQVV